MSLRRKNRINVLFTIGIVLWQIGCTASEKKYAPFPKYPNGVLTEHFELLKESDMVHFYEHVSIHENLKPGSPYVQWNCSKDVNFKLVPLPSDDLKKPYYESEIKFKNEIGKHVYSQRRAVEYVGGLDFQKWFKEIGEDEPHFCVAGFLVDIDKKTTPHTYHWIWETIKTRKGYMDFFFRDWTKKW